MTDIPLAPDAMIDTVGALLHDSQLPLKECLNVMLFVLGDVAAQCTDESYDPEFASFLTNLLEEAYRFNCTASPELAPADKLLN